MAPIGNVLAIQDLHTGGIETSTVEVHAIRCAVFPAPFTTVSNDV